ncbi:MAG: UDP-N-acetylmuramoyl-tripeptide--D-alanyl-D-alanine ligase [Planctomycetota bacterium]|jgi:UDP-N-acetylmuramoyl-tripeptide--D-alanyl-D-alanine ligase
MKGVTFQDLLDATGARQVAGAPRALFQGISTDTRTLTGEELFVSLSGPNFDGDGFAAGALQAGATGALVRKARGALLTGAAPVAEHPDPRRALGDLARWYRSRWMSFDGARDRAVVGITGSCGKTSTKEILIQLLGACCEAYGSPASFNNDIGVPLTLLRTPENADVCVVEMGTNAPGEIANLCRIAQPNGAIITNIGDSHLAGLGSTQGVAAEKEALVTGLSSHHFCVLNADCAFTPRLKARTAARILTFGLNGDALVCARDLHFENGSTQFVLEAPGLARPVQVTAPFLGAHMVQNLLAALAAVHGLGYSIEAVLPNVARLRGAQGRMQMHRVGGLTLVDDSYNANPLSASAGVAQLAGMLGYGRRVMVLGDMLELGERCDSSHRDLGRQVAQAGIDVLVAVGQHADLVLSGASEQSAAGPTLMSWCDAEGCMRELPALLQDGDLVFVKGSRAIGLDRLVDQLLRDWGAQPA